LRLTIADPSVKYVGPLAAATPLPRSAPHMAWVTKGDSKPLLPGVPAQGSGCSIRFHYVSGSFITLHVFQYFTRA